MDDILKNLDGKTLKIYTSRGGTKFRHVGDITVLDGAGIVDFTEDQFQQFNYATYDPEEDLPGYVKRLGSMGFQFGYFKNKRFIHTEPFE